MTIERIIFTKILLIKANKTLNPSAIANPAPCNMNTPHGNDFDNFFHSIIGLYSQFSS